MSSRAAARVLDARNLSCVLVLGLSLTLTGCIAARARDDSSGSENARHSDGHIAACYIAYGLEDGSNEGHEYAPRVYKVANPPIEPELRGNPNIVDLDRWQEITLTLSIDQAGNVVDGTPSFVGPEWGGVDPFSLTSAERSLCRREGFSLPVYYDQGFGAFRFAAVYAFGDLRIGMAEPLGAASTVSSEADLARRSPNWLPAPKGPFFMVLRQHWPKPEAPRARHTNPKMKANEDASYTFYFGPTAPEGKDGNWSRLCPVRAASYS